MIRHTLLFSLILPFVFPQFSRGQAVGPLVPRMAVRCETSALSSQPLALIAGETINLEVRFTAYNAPLDIGGASVMLHARTNGMDEGYSWQLSGEARDGGLAVVRIDTSAWLPPSFKKGEWRLEVIQTNSASLLRAGGQISVMGTGIGSASAPVPSAVLHELWEAIAHLQTSTNAWDAAYSWGNHTGLYLDLPAWQTWLSTNTLATTSYVNQALSAIPAPQIDRISSTNQIIDANGDVYSITTTNMLGWRIEVPDRSYNLHLPAVPYPLSLGTFDSVTISKWDFFGDDLSVTVNLMDQEYSNMSVMPHDTYIHLGSTLSQPAYMYYGDTSTSSTQLIDRLALASELDGGSYVNRQNGTATNLTLAGWVAMPQSQPTNLVLRLVASNEFILVKEVLQ